MSRKLNRYAMRLLAVVPRSGHAESAAAYAVARAISRAGFTIYLGVVIGSVSGLLPLGSRLKAGALLALGGVAALASLRVRAHVAPTVEQADTVAPTRGLEVVGRLTCVAGAFAMLATLVLALLLPVGAYDALGYRLPAAAQWLDAGALTWVAGDDPLRNGYPLGLEVIEAVLFRAFDSPMAVDAVASFFVVAGALALAGFARELGAKRAAALLVAGLFMLVPMHVLNAPSGYADAAFAGVMVLLLVAAARWAFTETVQREHGFDFGIALALVVALKPHGFAFGALTLAAALLVRVRRDSLRVLASELALLVALLTSGLFFAARNVLMKGNPLYPLEIAPFGRVWLRGRSSLDGILTPDFNVPPELARLPGVFRPLWVWLQPHGPARTFDERLAGFGYAFLLVGLPALGWFAVQWFRRGSVEREGLRPAAFMLALTLACWLLQPLAFWPRFSSWLWGAAGLALALLLSSLVEGGRQHLAVALALLAALLAVPEAAYALAHVKGLDQLGLSIFRYDANTVLARVAGLDQGFLERVLLGRRDVCRTPWRLGTDDANLDGVVAQLSPRPRMHVVAELDVDKLDAALQAHGCDELIAIGNSPLLKKLLPVAAGRIEAATAFGRCHLISSSTALGVTP